MEIQNKRIPDAEFEALRQEVLTQWPTGKDVNLEEAIAYHKAMPEYRSFPRSWSPLRRKAVPWYSPVQAFPLLKSTSS